AASTASRRAAVATGVSPARPLPSTSRKASKTRRARGSISSVLIGPRPLFSYYEGGSITSKGSAVMQEITIYTTTSCSYCQAAKRLLTQRGLAFKEIDLTSDQEL